MEQTRTNGNNYGTKNDIEETSSRELNVKFSTMYTNEMKAGQKKINSNNSFKNTHNFKSWKLGSINIRSGKEKSEGANMYAVAKEIDRLGITICCLQEVRYRNNDKRTISLPSGTEYEFIWSGPKRRRDNGVGFLVKLDKNIVAEEPDTQDPRVIAMNINLYGFKMRLVNAYSPTNTDGSSCQKDDFYRKVRTTCVSKITS